MLCNKKKKQLKTVQRETERDRDRKRQRDRDRETERQRDRETETDRQRETERNRETERQTETETDRETEREREHLLYTSDNESLIQFAFVIACFCAKNKTLPTKCVVACVFCNSCL